jgi:peptide/nickel transport system permease protein
MPEVTAAVPVEPDEDPVIYKKGLGITAWLSIGWLTIIGGAAILAPFVGLNDPNNIRNPVKLSYFQEGFIFGTDDNGRDVFARAMFGGSASLTIALLSIAFGTLIGGSVGLIAGYFGGKIGTVLASLFDILLAFPPLLLALTLVSVLSPSTEASDPPTRMDRILVVALAVGLVTIPILARITRANTLQWAQREFVMAARAQGAKPLGIMFREVLPNVVPAMLSIALLGVATVIITEGGLALFGLSVLPPDPSWGSMVASQIDDLDVTPHVWIVPSMIIFLTVMSLNFLGDVVRDKFSVREAAI